MNMKENCSILEIERICMIDVIIERMYFIIGVRKINSKIIIILLLSWESI